MFNFYLFFYLIIQDIPKLKTRVSVIGLISSIS